jgi:ABC-type branched-subunit amino acid transport system ATPase component
MITLRADGITKFFGGLRALNDVTIEATPGAIVGLIGPNGAGKSTLLSILAGEQAPTRGRIYLAGSDVTSHSAARRARAGVSRTFQNLRLFRDSSVFDNVVVGSRLWRSVTWRSRLAGRRRGEVGAQASEVLRRAGLPEQIWARPAGGLPYIQQRLLEIARGLATEPTFLLLDEPVAGANDPERLAIAALIRRVAESGVGVVLIEHDMAFMFELAETIIVLDHGEVISRGTAAEVQRDPVVVEAYLGAVGER